TENVSNAMHVAYAAPSIAAQSAAAPGFSTDLDAAIQAHEVAANWGKQGNAGIAGDKNGDGRVDIFDIAFISSAMTFKSAVEGKTAEVTSEVVGDADGDGAVNSADVDVVSNNWRQEGEAGI